MVRNVLISLVGDKNIRYRFTVRIDNKRGGEMRKILIVTAALVIFAGFAMTVSAEAAVFIPIGDSMFTPVIHRSSTGSNTYVTYSQWGSVWMGSSNQDANILETALQAAGTYGVGVPLSPLGLMADYTVKFDYHFRTWDDASHDTFQAVITQGNYLWNGGTLIGGYTWGGNDRGGKETLDLQPATQQFSVSVTPASDYYLNVLLQTTGDNTKPSWGRFSDVAVATPEPATLAVFGLGAFGFFGLKRKKK